MGEEGVKNSEKMLTLIMDGPYYKQIALSMHCNPLQGHYRENLVFITGMGLQCGQGRVVFKGVPSVSIEPCLVRG